MKRTLVTVFAVLATIGALSAGQEVNERKSASPDGVVQIDILAGAIRVIGWDTAEVEITGTIDEQAEEIEISGSGDRTSIDIFPKGSHHKNFEGADLEIRIPRESRLEVDSISASLEISDLTGRVSLSTVSGNITIHGQPNQAQVETVSGTITLEDGSNLEEGEFESVSGNIHVTSDFSSKGNFQFETVSGTIEIRVPAGIVADFEASTFSGSIKNELGPEAERKSTPLPSQELSFSTGSGGARISAESFSGTVKILRQ